MSSSSIRRGTLAATALALSLAVLTACGAGNNAETLKINPDNARVTAGHLRIQNAVVITPPEETGGPAAVSARIFNNGDRDQTLDRLTVAKSGEELTLAGKDGRGGVVVPAHGSVLLGGEGHASAVLAGGHDAGQGATEKLAFEFSEEGEVRISAMVVGDEGQYADFGATPTPTATATPEPGAGEDGEPGDDAGTGTDGTSDASTLPDENTTEDATADATESTPGTDEASSSDGPVVEQ